MSLSSTPSSSTPSGAVTGSEPGAEEGEPPALALLGDVARPRSLTVAELRGEWEEFERCVTFDCATSGPRLHTFAGPLLRDVVTTAGPAFRPAGRKDRARYLIAVTGGDGHRSLLSWAELDPDFGDSPVLLATSMDGRTLDAVGSQLVVPSDRCGARYVSAITRLWFGAYEPAR